MNMNTPSPPQTVTFTPPLPSVSIHEGIFDNPSGDLTIEAVKQALGFAPPRIRRAT
jgi:hypothetical protein